ncbi:acyl carrier protein [Acidithiobacillus ferrooxidans]|uniref:Acyl carrier protein n=2 Tax=Acidithiobacillus ferrooxidans TaxID=920 RepID=A0A2W1K527_ACIFR|nr:acyl carrier protein [Acidithiobacillus ferrooxidans]MBU2817909.1 acyl carrier protein [Acidithiobacillus ferrooxidans]PZD81809.1 acyl carrier protein [Acidithiobacillus ferrooxidans]QLK41898.1 acyl carrier protein [Acidithiobacillus ferrooxidans]RRN84993.1 MAG: acyl carrier protein [Acidithiobacillus ferrooxidans]
MPQNDEIMNRVKDLIARQFAINRDLVVESARLFEDLGLDSMDSVELVMALEVEFGGEVPDVDITLIKTVGDVIQAVNTYFAPPDSAA